MYYLYILPARLEKLALIKNLKYYPANKFAMKNLLTFSLIFLLTSCGFKPLYKRETDKDRCSNFIVNPVKFSLAGQKMRYTIQDKLNQACIDEKNNYELDIKVNVTEQAIAVQKDREVTRFNIVMDGDYTLKNSATGKPIYTGKTRSVGGYDAVISDYGTYSLRQDTKNKLSEEMATEIAFKISYLLKSKSSKK